MTTKNELPLIIISNGSLVVCAEPCVEILVEIDPVLEPSPTCFALTEPFVSVAAEALRVVWYKRSLNEYSCALYAVVFTFDILLPITSISFIWVFSPETAEYNALTMSPSCRYPETSVTLIAFDKIILYLLSVIFFRK